METMVASVLIVVIFMVASLILNNYLRSYARNNTTAIEEVLTELEYRAGLGNLKLPYEDKLDNWIIEAEQVQRDGLLSIEFTAKRIEDGKELKKRSIVKVNR